MLLNLYENGYLYREHFPYALRSASFKTKPAEKIGIVGRTGSGKSSLFQALFRLVDHCVGDIRIDDVSIKSLNLRDLRFLILLWFLFIDLLLFLVADWLHWWHWFVWCTKVAYRHHSAGSFHFQWDYRREFRSHWTVHWAGAVERAGTVPSSRTSL